MASDREGGDTAQGDTAHAGTAPAGNLIDRVSDRLDRWQRSVPPLAVVHAVLKKPR